MTNDKQQVLTDPYGKKWQEEDEAILISGLQAGDSWDEIGTELERTAEAVENKAYRMGLVGPKAKADSV